MAGHPHMSNALSEATTKVPSSRRALARGGPPRTDPCALREDDGIVVWMSWVYIVRCSDKSLYVGHTDDLDSRERTHNEGRGSRYTAQRRPVHVVYFERHDSSETAIARERQLKRWTTNKKEALIAGNLGALKSLSRRRKN
jgi:putative endonuclease